MCLPARCLTHLPRSLQEATRPRTLRDAVQAGTVEDISSNYLAHRRAQLLAAANQPVPPVLATMQDSRNRLISEHVRHLACLHHARRRER